ncbi:MAG: sucrose phosphorylase [Anaerolineae bacterium]|jgi:sucrose 6(F)-phosphate phosphorylase|nr:sucrose phosphorylase [Anaerolineae bacterium]
MAVKNKVQLITYPDSLGGDLKTLYDVLETDFKDIFKGGIHILPPFPSSGDRGFAPLTYLEIEPAFGDWDDIQHLGKKYDILLDLMVNHISAKSVFFQDFLKKGKKAEYADLFLTIDKIWTDGEIPADDFEKIFLRRTEPYSDFEVGEDGAKVRVWTTFGKVTPSEQIDLDVNSEATRQLFTEFFENFSKKGVKIVRLDAVGYINKIPGSSFFFVEPEIHQFLDWVTELAHSLDIELLPEVHTHYSIQNKLSEKGHWIYDFILPYRVLEALLNKNSIALNDYLRKRPEKQFTMLDCHDGVPIKPDLDDLYKSEDARKLVDTCLERGSNLSLIYAPKYHDDDGFDVHQIRGTYYSMLGADDDSYLAARAIQFFAPGVPQVYYVGALAGENDVEILEKGGEGRDINRHNYSLNEIKQEVTREVVQRLLKLIRFRNEYPAFDGEFTVLESSENEVNLSWQKGPDFCSLKIDLDTMKSVIYYRDSEGNDAQYLV